MVPDLADTIVALATSPAGAARAIVRLSGPCAFDIVAALTGHSIHHQANRLQTVSIPLPGLHAPLPTDIYAWHKPRSYTGQNVVELHTIGSPPLVELLVASCLNAGARAAQPGEFTMRAFLAGKFDLTRAEAVLGVIEAGNRTELQQALAQLAGGVARPLHALREDLLNLLADLEAGLDFTDEDIHFVSLDDLLKRLGKAMAHLINLRRQVEDRGASGKTFRVVLAGPPNAGKSSLFNALVGTAAALVSPQPGTTRDYLEAEVKVDGLSLLLIDTAGLRPAPDELENAAQDLGKNQAHQADLVLWCVPAEKLGAKNGAPHKVAAAPLHDVVQQVGLREDQVILVGTKADLGMAGKELLATSAVSGAGMHTLKNALAEKLRAAQRPALAPSLSRCRHHVDQALEGLRRAHHLALEEQPHELTALELRLALEQLGAMVGAVYTDDLLDRIFSRFCIGK